MAALALGRVRAIECVLVGLLHCVLHVLNMVKEGSGRRGGSFLLVCLMLITFGQLALREARTMLKACLVS